MYDRRRLLVLSHHAGYACRRTGACCTAGWRIPVEAERVHGIGSLPARRDVFEEGTTILRLQPDGACVLFEPGRAGRPSACMVHRTRGHAALPSACRHFPRVFLHDAVATRLALSHFCPTAASLLFTDDPLRIVDAPAGLMNAGDREGLDAREALPPLLHPGVLMDPASYARWEAHAVELMGASDTPEGALARIAAGVERLRHWHPGDGALADALASATTGEEMAVPPDSRAGDHTDWLVDAACGAVPPGLESARPLQDADADARFVAPGWRALSHPIRRYLAGRLFGSWVAYQGRGLRTVVAAAACALSVLRREAGRACAAVSRPLDAPLLVEAIRRTDLLLVHLVDRQALADRLSGVEAWQTPPAGRHGPAGAGRTPARRAGR